MLRRENSNSQQLKDQLRKMESKRNGLQQELDNLQEKHVELKMNVAELETQLESARSGVSAVTLEIRHMLNEVNSEKPFYSIVLAVYISGHGIVLIAWTRKRNCAPCVPCRFTAEQERERWKADKLYKHDLEHLQEREENLQQVLRREQNLQLEMEEQQLERNILLGNVKQVWRLMGFAWASSITTTALPDVSMSTTDPFLRNLSINCHTVLRCGPRLSGNTSTNFHCTFSLYSSALRNTCSTKNTRASTDKTIRRILTGKLEWSGDCNSAYKTVIFFLIMQRCIFCATHGEIVLFFSSSCHDKSLSSFISFEESFYPCCECSFCFTFLIPPKTLVETRTFNGNGLFSFLKTGALPKPSSPLISESIVTEQLKKQRDEMKQHFLLEQNTWLAREEELQKILELERRRNAKAFMSVCVAI